MISASGSHSIRALIELARLDEGEFAGAGAIARAIDAPENYLGKLLQTLARAGLLESRKGMGGGFRLARDPATITIYDVIDPVEQLGRWQNCFLGLTECSKDTVCPVHDDWGALRDRYLELLSGRTIADLLQGGGRFDIPVEDNRAG